MDINQFLTWLFEEHNFIAAILLPFWMMLYSVWKGYTLQSVICLVIWLIKKEAERAAKKSLDR